MSLVRWVHAGSVHGFHGKWRVGGEGIVVLDGRLVVLVMVVGVVCSVRVPGSVLVLKGFLVEVVVVIHVQLAHVVWRQLGSGGLCGANGSRGYTRLRAGGRTEQACGLAATYMHA